VALFVDDRPSFFNDALRTYLEVKRGSWPPGHDAFLLVKVHLVYDRFGGGGLLGLCRRRRLLGRLYGTLLGAGLTGRSPAGRAPWSLWNATRHDEQTEDRRVGRRKLKIKEEVQDDDLHLRNGRRKKSGGDEVDELNVHARGKELNDAVNIAAVGKMRSRKYLAMHNKDLAKSLSETIYYRCMSRKVSCLVMEVVVK
jgi:hypothetical protein